jgi:hypothetical protein
MSGLTAVSPAITRCRVWRLRPEASQSAYPATVQGGQNLFGEKDPRMNRWAGDVFGLNKVFFAHNSLSGIAQCWRLALSSSRYYWGRS